MFSCCQKCILNWLYVFVASIFHLFMPLSVSKELPKYLQFCQVSSPPLLITYSSDFVSFICRFFSFNVDGTTFFKETKKQANVQKCRAACGLRGLRGTYPGALTHPLISHQIAFSARIDQSDAVISLLPRFAARFRPFWGVPKMA